MSARTICPLGEPCLNPGKCIDCQRYSIAGTPRDGAAADIDRLRAALDRAEAEKAREVENSVKLGQAIERRNVEIDRLRAELAAVREALEPFSRLLDTDGSGYESSADDEIVRSIGTLGRDYQFITVGDLRTARTALQSHRRTEEAPTADEPEHDSSITREQRHRDEQEERLRRKYPGDRRTEEAT